MPKPHEPLSSSREGGGWGYPDLSGPTTKKTFFPKRHKIFITILGEDLFEL